jgi:hypothetical protein
MAKYKRITRPKKITVSLYLDENLAQAVAAKALMDRRTMSQFVSIILEKALGVKA